MAKKTAPKKKAAPAKAKAVKATKPIKTAKAAKAVKSASKSAPKATVKLAKTTKVKAVEKTAQLKPSKPALMTKKGKIHAELAETEEKPAPKKASTIVSIIETEASGDDSVEKVEKTSKVKPVKVDRGNLNDEKAKWSELNKKYGRDKALTYKMTESYSSLIPLQHKVLGWGFILTNENDRLEVLFENGIRMLISNYKS
jgi:hypothetical protein